MTKGMVSHSGQECERPPAPKVVFGVFLLVIVSVITVPAVILSAAQHFLGLTPYLDTWSILFYSCFALSTWVFVFVVAFSSPAGVCSLGVRLSAHGIPALLRKCTVIPWSSIRRFETNSGSSTVCVGIK